jgi:hypothetical protein
MSKTKPIEEQIEIAKKEKQAKDDRLNELLQLYFKKNNKNPELARKLKEVIPQISQSNKWPLRVPVERDGKTIMLNSYSLLQDRYFEHMRAAGFDGFERGEHGSTAEHLDVLDYKIKQDTARAEMAAAVADEKEREAAAMEKKAEQKERQLANLDRKLEIRKGAEADISALDNFGNNKTMFGQIIVSPDEAKDVKRLAREGVASRGEIDELKSKLARANAEKDKAVKDRDIYKSRWEKLRDSTAEFFKALARAPKRVMEFLADIMRQPPEKAEPERGKQKSKQEAR